MATRAPEFSPALLALLQQHLPTDGPIRTLGQGQPNWIVGVEPNGLLVETERTRTNQTGPQLVSSWMIEVAWQRLTSHGTLTAKELVSADGLNVRRSSCVCAVLSQLPGVEVASTRPILLSYDLPT